MKSNLEIEYKMLLTEKEYLTLLNNLQNSKIVDQTNIYYDTNPSLVKRNMGCRIRIIDSEYFFTLKIKQDIGIKEVEFEIPSLDLDNDKIRNVFDKYNIKDIKKVGELRTIRHIYTFEQGIICLDKNFYNDKVDYEIEYELFEGFNDYTFLVNLLKNNDINYIPNTISKLERCLNSKKDIQ
ncbi:MAG: CYTH domain-containing protein [Anaerorhabdus sp.]